MGLGLSVNGESVAHWSYSGFNEFRTKVAAAIGINLRKMQGFSDVDRSLLEKSWESYRQAIEEDTKKEKISWDTVDDPIKHLLHHSDCEGEIAAEYCGVIADRLEEIIKDWPTKIVLHPDPFWQDRSFWRDCGYPAEMVLDDYDYTQANSLIAGLRKAVELNVPLEFH